MFNWNNYLGLAQKLAQNEDEESKRSAISRAYYGAFNITRKHLESKGLAIKGKDKVHYAVWNGMYQLSHEERKISVIGDRLRVKRTKVDYDNNINDINKLTQAALLEAQEITNKINKLNN